MNKNVSLKRVVVLGVVLGIIILILISSSRTVNNQQNNVTDSTDSFVNTYTQKSREQLQKEASELSQIIKDKLKDTDITEVKSYAIEKIVRSSVTEKTNTFKDKIREISINTANDNENQFTVFVAINGDELASKESIKNSLFAENSDIYIALYKDRQDIREVWIISYVVTVDKYGNESDTVVLKTSLDSVEAKKINWNQDKTVLEFGILPSVWTTVKSDL